MGGRRSVGDGMGEIVDVGAPEQMPGGRTDGGLGDDRQLSSDAAGQMIDAWASDTARAAKETCGVM
jgi:hypothetical protein